MPTYIVNINYENEIEAIGETEAVEIALEDVNDTRRTFTFTMPSFKIYYIFNGMAS
jgi:hypothetical protein